MGIGPSIKKIKEPTYDGLMRSTTNEVRHRRGPSLAKATNAGFNREWTKNRPPAFVKHFDNFTIINSDNFNGFVNKAKKKQIETE